RHFRLCSIGPRKTLNSDRWINSRGDPAAWSLKRPRLCGRAEIQGQAHFRPIHIWNATITSGAAMVFLGGACSDRAGAYGSILAEHLRAVRARRRGIRLGSASLEPWQAALSR